MSCIRLAGILTAILAIASPYTKAATVVTGKWSCVENRNFRVFTDARERDAADLLLNLEQFRRSVGQLVGQDQPLSVPIDVYLFRDEVSFRPFWPMIGGQQVRVGGSFTSDMPKGRISLQRTWGGDQTTRTVFHEYTHYLSRDFKWPLWLHEGVAEYFSTFRLVKQGVRLGAPIPEHLQILRERPLIPLDTLVTMDREDVGYRDERLTSTFYAESWALFHMLRLGQDPELAGTLQNYLRGLQDGRDGAELFREVFGQLPIGSKLQRYALQHAWYALTVPADSSEIEKTMTRRPVESGEIRVRLAELLISGGLIDAARQYLELPGAGATIPPGWYEVKGVEAIRESRWKEGAEFFRQAIEQEPKSFLNHFYYAWCLRNSAGRFRQDEDSSIETMIDHLQQAVALRPYFLEGFEWLAEMCLYLPERLDQGVIAAVRGIRLKPTRHELALVLARLMVAKGDHDAARATLDRLAAVGVERSIQEQADEIRVSMERSSGPEDPADDWAEIEQWVEMREESAAPDEPSPGREAAPRPTLRRDSPSGSVPAHRGPESDVPSECNPAFVQVHGKPWVSGMLRELKCDSRALTFVLDVSGRKLELWAPHDARVVFTCEPIVMEFRCGPFQAPVIAYYEEGADSQRALAIEIRSGSEEGFDSSPAP